MQFVTKNFVKYRVGKIPVLVEAVHDAGPMADLYTGKLAKGVSDKTHASCLIGIQSREVVDLNRPMSCDDSSVQACAVREYREAIQNIVSKTVSDYESKMLENPYLFLSFHGMKDRKYADIEIGTCHNKSCSRDMVNFVVENLRKRTSFTVVVDNKFCGTGMLVNHREGDCFGEGFGPMFQSMQIEISRTLRESHCKEIVALFSELITEFSGLVKTQDL